MNASIDKKVEAPMSGSGALARMAAFVFLPGYTFLPDAKKVLTEAAYNHTRGKLYLELGKTAVED